MPTPADILPIAELCLSLSSNDIAKNNALRRGALVNRTPILIYMAYRAMKKVYDKDNNYAGMQALTNYIYKLCGKWALQAEGILALNGGGGIVNPTTGNAAAIVFFDDEIAVPTSGQLVVGDTSYTLPYSYVIEGSVTVELPQSNVPEGRADQFSCTIAYRVSGTTINFTNDDGAGTNLGVTDGMLIMIRGARYISATPSGSIPTGAAPEQIAFFGNEVIASVYTNTDFDGWNSSLYYNGVGFLLQGTHFIISAGGVFTFIGVYSGVAFTSADVFILTPIGLL